MSTTPLAEFVSSLWETGQVRVPELPADGSLTFSADDLAESELRLLSFASDESAALPGSPPAIDNQAAMWGLKAVFTVSSLIVHRRLTVAAFEPVLVFRHLKPVTTSVIYSVDLTLQCVPELHRMALALAESDPLCDVLEHLGRSWPLSSVGLRFRAGHEPDDQTIGDAVTTLWQNDCLRQLYLDRITEREALERLNAPLVRDAIRAILGLHHDLSPVIAAAIEDDPLPSATLTI
jgi:hypothetical protein